LQHPQFGSFQTSATNPEAVAFPAKAIDKRINKVVKTGRLVLSVFMLTLDFVPLAECRIRRLQGYKQIEAEHRRHRLSGG